jgi:hypothetical protein
MSKRVDSDSSRAILIPVSGLTPGNLRVLKGQIANAYEIYYAPRHIQRVKRYLGIVHYELTNGERGALDVEAWLNLPHP